ncbi:MAG TPA: NAD-dependent epimerase/dehydratase family protein [Candidatus Limnocylindrales bacterium]|nr:NAD-dependent epimerase/dehydratase family protein [Candidatus Limnocylindrales bacterium]
MSGRLLITGGGGLLGLHLTRRFRSDGIPVRLFEAAPVDGLAPGVEAVTGDVRDVRALASALDGVDVIVHAAFASPRAPIALIERVNVEGTRAVCAAALSRGVRRLTPISSTVVHQRTPRHPLLPESPRTRVDAYRRSVLGAEAGVAEHGRRGLSVAVARPKTVFGPERVRGFAIVFEWVRRGQPVIVLGAGHNRYQLLDVRDFADGLRRLADSDAGGLFEFGAREFGTVREDLGALLAHAGTGARLRFVPGPIARAALATMELAGMVPASGWHYSSAAGADSALDVTRAERELGWRPTRSNRQTLIDAYDWYAASMGATGRAPAAHPLPLSHRVLSALATMLPGG